MRKGFTLIELLVVVALVAILSAIALPRYRKAIEHSRTAEPRTVWSTISKMANMAFLERLLDGNKDTCDMWYEQAGLTSAGGNTFTSKYFVYTNATCAANSVSMQASRQQGGAVLYTLNFTIRKAANLELITQVLCADGTMENACADLFGINDANNSQGD